MDNPVLIQDLVKLNEIEIFLKKFLEKHTEYKTSVIGISDEPERDYQRLMQMIKKEWNKPFPESPFFLEGSDYHINEDFFIPANKNVSIIKNLRYFPFILHSHQFIELNYVLCSDGSSIVTADKSVSLTDGDIILCPPGFTHCFSAQNENSIIIDFIIRITTFDTVFFNLLDNDNYLSSLFTNALYNPSKGYIIWHCKNDASLGSNCDEGI